MIISDTERLAFLTKTHNQFINCGAYEEAIGWHRSKIDVATSMNQLKLMEEFTFQLGSLLKRYENNISETFKIEYQSLHLIFLASIYESQGHYSKSLTLHQKVKNNAAFDIGKLGEEQIRALAENHQSIGTLYFSRKEYKMAILYFERALEYSRELEWPISKYSRAYFNLNELSKLYIEIGDFEKAYEYILEAISQADLFAQERLVIYGGRIENYLNEKNSALKMMAKFHLQLNQLDSAQFYIDELERNDWLTSDIAILRTNLNIQNGQGKRAKEILYELLEKKSTEHSLCNGIQEESCLDIVKCLIHLEDQQLAIKILNTLENDITESISASSNKSSSAFYRNQSILLELLSFQIQLSKPNKPNELNQKVKNAFALIKSGMQNAQTQNDKLGFSQNSASITENHLNTLSQSRISQTNEALFSMETSKAVLAFESWIRHQINKEGFEKSLIEQEQKLDKEIIALTKKQLESVDSLEIHRFEEMLVEMKKERSNHIVDIKAQFPRYYQMKYDWQIPNVLEIQSVLDKNETFINYFSGAEFLYALIISKETSKLHRVDDAAKIKKYIKAFTNEIYREITPNKDSIDYAYLLYQHLLEPFASDLKDHIIISPSGHLQQVPFAALKTKESNNGWPKYLVHSYAITYTPSGSFLHQQRLNRVPQHINNSLLVAPSFQQKNTVKDLYAMRSGFGKLIFNTQEIEYISNLVNHNLLIGEQATRSAALSKLKNKDLVHFSTHAKSNIDVPDKSFVAFYSPLNSDQTDTSKLFLDDLSKLNLSAKMVVLSACETGLGKIFNGEGAMSLANGCFYGGTQSVVATLWSVRDKPSFDIMTGFYKNLNDGHPKDKALQMAQIEYLEINNGKWAAPYYWAGHTVFGNSDALIFHKNNSLFILLGLGIFLMIVLSIFLFVKTR